MWKLCIISDVGYFIFQNIEAPSYVFEARSHQIYHDVFELVQFKCPFRYNRLYLIEFCICLQVCYVSIVHGCFTAAYETIVSNLLLRIFPNGESAKWDALFGLLVFRHPSTLISVNRKDLTHFWHFDSISLWKNYIEASRLLTFGLCNVFILSLI